jgi:hypothetical protein
MKKWRHLPELFDYVGRPFVNGNGYGTGASGVTMPDAFIGGGMGHGFWGAYESNGSGCGHGDIDGGGAGPRYYPASASVRSSEVEIE